MTEPLNRKTHEMPGKQLLQETTLRDVCWQVIGLEQDGWSSLPGCKKISGNYHTSSIRLHK